MVDIDGAELAKFNKLGRGIDIPIHADAGQFIQALGAAQYNPRWTIWRALIQTWKDRYPPPDDGPSAGAYELIRNLDIPEDSIICSDTGFALGWMMQAFPFKGQRFLHAFNMTPMGYGLPAAVGAALASTCPVTLVSGDGSFMMSLPELATVSRWKFPIRIILLNNKAHGMCMQTERQWFGGRHSGTNIDGGLGFPDFQKVADAFGVTIDERHISSEAHMEPQARYGQPIEDADPLLPWDEFKSQMIVPPVERK
jgi:acetolactate synthase-1/2/3 large subunit